MKTTALKLVSAAALIVALFACGGGGGGTDNPTPTPTPIINTAPIANAGVDQSVVANAIVTLDGSASSDANSDPLTYAWTLSAKPQGSAAALDNPTSAKPTFTADAAGAYMATLVVNDGKINSNPDTVNIAVSVDNAAPVASAGVAQNVSVGTVVTLDGSASSDANRDPLTYAWALTAKPAGSAATLSSTTSAKPTFSADVAGTYAASLVVNDGKVNSSNAASVSITAAVANVTPVANAGVAQNVAVGSVVTLDSSASSDANNDPLTYVWSLTAKPAGSTSVLSSANSVKPTFTTDVVGTYVASLIVNDGKVNSNAATVSITAASANIAPIANAGVAQTVVAGSVVTLDGSASSDANSDPLTYSWTLTSKPSGSTVILNQPTSVRPTFTADVAGNYVASLVVNDGKFNSNVGTVAITISQPAALSQSIDRAVSSWAISSTTSAVDGKKTTIMVGKSGSYGTRFDIYCGSDGSKGYFISTDYITGSGYFKYRIGQNPVVTQTWSESAGTGFKSLFPPSFDLSLLKQMYQNWDFSAQAHKYGAGYIDTAMDLSGFSAMIDKTRADCGWSSATFPPNNGWSNDYPDVPPSGAKEAIYVDGATEQFGLIAWRALNPSGQQQLLVRLGQNKSLCVGNVLIDDKRLYVEQDGKRVSAVSGTDFQLSCKNQLPVTFALQGNFDASRPFVLSAYAHHTNSLNPGQPISSVTVD